MDKKNDKHNVDKCHYDKPPLATNASKKIESQENLVRFLYLLNMVYDIIAKHKRQNNKFLSPIYGSYNVQKWWMWYKFIIMRRKTPKPASLESV